MTKIHLLMVLGALLLFLLFRIWKRVDRAKITQSKAFSFEVFAGLGAIFPLMFTAATILIFLALLPCGFSSGMDYTEPAFYSTYFSDPLGMGCAALGLIDAAVIGIFFWVHYFEIVIFGLIALLVGALYALVAGYDPTVWVSAVFHFTRSQTLLFVGFVVS